MVEHPLQRESVSFEAPCYLTFDFGPRKRQVSEDRLESSVEFNIKTAYLNNSEKKRQNWHKVLWQNERSRGTSVFQYRQHVRQTSS